jgi:hypothetical protein
LKAAGSALGIPSIERPPSVELGTPPSVGVPPELLGVESLLHAARRERVTHRIESRRNMACSS